nr:hypothetical protein [uncultured Sphaerochaeta sp.]
MEKQENLYFGKQDGNICIGHTQNVVVNPFIEKIYNKRIDCWSPERLSGQ